MNIETVRDYCLTFPAVIEEVPFGPTTLVFKVGGKMFLLLNLDQVPLSFNVKCEPEVALELRETWHGVVLPGYHMNKKHWNTVYLQQPVPEQQLKQWIKASYDLVVASLPKKVRDEIQYL